MDSLEPYVKLIEEMDGREHAWRASRSWIAEKDLNMDKMKEMDLSLNSLKVFIIEFRSTTVFRDMIFAIRPLNGWAASTRSMQGKDFNLKISSEFEWDETSKLQIKETLEKMKNGGNRDKLRGDLPVTVSTKYTVSMDYRIVVALCKSLYELNTDLFMLYGRMLLSACKISEDDFFRSVIKPIHPFLKIYDEEKINGTNSTAGRIIFGHYNVKLALASQFLRQHYSKIKIGYWNSVEDYFTIQRQQKEKIDIAFYIDVDSYHRLMSMRCHWALDWSEDMWGGIAKDYISGMSADEFWNFLPNGAGKRDPYFADIYNRVIHEDPGIPCPIMCEWPEMIEWKWKDIGNSAILDKYIELVEHGYIKDNPLNEHRVKYLEIKNES